MVAGPIARWLRRHRAKAAPHWKDDARRGFLFGLASAGPVLNWLGLR